MKLEAPELTLLNVKPNNIIYKIWFYYIWTVNCQYSVGLKDNILAVKFD